eukprot:TRINITY_DN27551_c0_g1_i1.p1 TRINITY_DN27551_c0_g1~~TRINITY_DN27551_c0_g1_i1.p1  ORF type:complete len:310 (-),score=61.63 TRINITY_DN27551_c0_g1_i1:20-877(-)
MAPKAKRTQHEPAKLGLEDTEAVLRGGYLAKPLVVQGLEVVGGKKFIRLWKTSPELILLLTQSSSCKRPLSQCQTFTIMQGQRNTMYKELLQQQAQPDANKASAEDDSDMEALGLDAPDSGGQKQDDKQPSRSPRDCKKYIAQLPPTIVLKLDHGDLPQWCPEVLLESGATAPAMHLTDENLECLAQFVRAQMQESPRKRRAAGEKSPRGPPSARQYFIEGRGWIRMEQSESKSNSSRSSRPHSGKKRYKVKTVQTVRQKQKRSKGARVAKPRSEAEEHESLNSW